MPFKIEKIIFFCIKNRKLNLQQYYNYSSEPSGAYFLTLCAKNFQNYFGEICEGKVVLNDVGKLVENKWKMIEEYFKNVKLDKFVVMPSHVHGIIFIAENSFSCSDEESRNVQLIPKIISQYKASVTREIRKNCSDAQSFWQKSFHDRIIQNKNELYQIQEYIVNNPWRWSDNNK